LLIKSQEHAYREWQYMGVSNKKRSDSDRELNWYIPQKWQAEKTDIGNRCYGRN